MRLPKRELLKCRKCKVKKGVHKDSKIPHPRYPEITHYLICNECNNNRTRKYYRKHKKKCRAIQAKSRLKNKQKE